MTDLHTSGLLFTLFLFIKYLVLMNHKEILQRLTAGNDRFVADKLKGKLNDGSRRNELLIGQEPFAIVLSCADSRVVPEMAFDTGLGELFVVRVAGNVANTSSIASMEYAVTHLGTQVIIILSHQNCGAVTAAVAGGDYGPNLNHLLEHISPAIKESSDPNSVDEVIRKNAELTVKVISKNSEIISKSVDAGKVEVVPAYYHLDSGKVEFLDA